MTIKRVWASRQPLKRSVPEQSRAVLNKIISNAMELHYFYDDQKKKFKTVSSSPSLPQYEERIHQFHTKQFEIAQEKIDLSPKPKSIKELEEKKLSHLKKALENGWSADKITAASYDEDIFEVFRFHLKQAQKAQGVRKQGKSNEPNLLTIEKFLYFHLQKAADALSSINLRKNQNIQKVKYHLGKAKNTQEEIEEVQRDNIKIHCYEKFRDFHLREAKKEAAKQGWNDTAIT